MTEHRRLVASARSLATARPRKSATGTRENETEIKIKIKKGIAIGTGTETETGKRTETEIMTTATGTGTEIGIETVNVNATVIVTVTATATAIARRTETVGLGTTAGTKMVVQRATTDVTANGKVTRHETVVTEIEIDTRHGYQVLDGMTGNDAPGRRRKIVVAAMTSHGTSGRQKMRSEARKCVQVF
jgi:hypothetical protein